MYLKAVVGRFGRFLLKENQTAEATMTDATMPQPTAMLMIAF